MTAIVEELKSLMNHPSHNIMLCTTLLRCYEDRGDKETVEVLQRFIDLENEKFKLLEDLENINVELEKEQLNEKIVDIESEQNLLAGTILHCIIELKKEVN